MNLDKEISIIEAILFMENEPIDLKSLCRISNLSKEVVVAAVEKIKETYAADAHGIELTETDEAFHFLPKQELWNQLRDRYGKRNDTKLSKAALETLSIIAYSQPITRGEVDAVRGVSSDSMIRILLQRNLVHEVGKKDAPGKPVQFGTTREFLKLFKLSSLSELPKLDELEHKRFESN